MAPSRNPPSLPITNENVLEFYEWLFAPWVKELGLRDFTVSPGQVIAAVFPGGTITGCPKVRCMEIIAELEAEARGPYTGAMGYLNHNGDMDLNILIRSAWLSGTICELRAGAGIVIDSVAEHELQESRAKAKGLLRALGADV